MSRMGEVMDREELIKFLKENLRIETKHCYGYYDTDEHYEIIIKLCKEEITSDTIYLKP